MPNQYSDSVAHKVALATCERYQDRPARWIARQLHADFPELYPNIEAARSKVRHVFGTTGAIHAKTAKLPREKRSPADDWRKFMPEAATTVETPWAPFTIAGRMSALILSDVH